LDRLYWRSSRLEHQRLLCADGWPIVKASLEASHSASEAGNRESM
jgi:hypothetical protein